MSAASRLPLADMAATLRLGAPIMVTQLSTMGQGVIEAVLAGHLDAHTLAATAIGVNVWVLAVMAASGVLLAVPPSVAQLDGAGRRGETASVFRQAIWLALAIGPLLGAALFWGGPALVRLLGVAPGLVPDVTAYLHAAGFAMPAIAVSFACKGFCEGLSMPRPAMVSGIAGLLLLGPLCYVLMYGAFGLPRLGAFGSGVAGAVVCWAQGLGFFAYVVLAPRFRALDWRGGRRGPDAAAIAGLLRIGLPMAVSVLLEVSLFSIASMVVGRFGDAAAGAYQVALNVAGLTFMVPLGVAFAVTVRVGNAVGRADPAGVRQAGFAGFLLVIATQSVSSLVLLSGAGTIAALYTSDPAVAVTATTLLRLAGLFQLVDGLQVAANGALRGLKDTRVPMAITALAYWGVGMPLGLYLAIRQGLAAPGMWIGLIAGLTTAAVLLTARFHLRSRHAPAEAAAVFRTAA